jgi:hypothetical protein
MTQKTRHFVGRRDVLRCAAFGSASFFFTTYFALGSVSIPGRRNRKVPRFRHHKKKCATYSEGTESIAVENWTGDDKDLAITTLRLGLIDFGHSGDGGFNVRLYDLLAGMLVRAGRQNELSALFPGLEKELDDIRLRLSSMSDSLAADCAVSVTNSKKREVRWREEEELLEVHKLQTYRLSLELRLRKWADADSKWNGSWRSDSRKWDGLDI